MKENTQLKGKGEGQIIQTKVDERVLSDNYKTTITLEKGKTATTLQGGIEYPLMFKEVLAGEYIKNWNIKNITRYLTPLVPTLDRIFITVKAFFVPHTRIHEDFEKNMAMAENEGTKTNSSQIPSATIQNTTTQNKHFKFNIMSRYGIPNDATTANYNIMLARGYRAIENDYLRIKEYEAPLTEWKGTTATAAEIAAVNTTESPTYVNSNSHYTVAFAKTRKNYLTNLKRRMVLDNQGESDEVTQLDKHLDWQNRYNLNKQNIANAEKNDWDIIAEMGGTEAVKADRVEFLGMQEYELNYQQITQTAPVIDGSSPLGTTGSFSYTKAEGDLFSHKLFKQHGFIHILVNINLENIFEHNTPKELLKLAIEDIYRPALANKEIQAMKVGEIKNKNTFANPHNMLAYQPAWEEYKRLPSFVSGEMQSRALIIDENETPPTRGASFSHWHNMWETPHTTISEEYFKPIGEINRVLARNNILNVEIDGYDPAIFDVDPIIMIHESEVKTSLPIASKVITATDKAEQNR